MRRRSFIAGLGATLAAPVRPAWPQQSWPRIGVLLTGGMAAPKDLALSAELARLGYVEGRNVAFEVRAVDGDIRRFPAMARELVAAGPRVLIGSSTPAANALMQATREIPIVMTVVGDPVATGLSTSMARPTGNITGFTLSNASLAAKRLELLSEVVPNLRRVLYLTVPDSPMQVEFVLQARQAAEKLGIALIPVAVSSTESVTEGFALAETEKAQAVQVESSPTNARLSSHIVNECLVRDWPAVHPWHFEVRGGALMSYGPAILENHAGVASYVDRILKGAKIAELPFQEPTEIRLAINLRTARSIKLKIPPSFLIRADEVIE